MEMESDVSWRGGRVRGSARAGAAATAAADGGKRRERVRSGGEGCLMRSETREGWIAASTWAVMMMDGLGDHLV